MRHWYASAREPAKKVLRLSWVTLIKPRAVHAASFPNKTTQPARKPIIIISRARMRYMTNNGKNGDNFLLNTKLLAAVIRRLRDSLAPGRV